MPVDYHDAAKRLYDDAGFLFDEGCYVTAEHLYGLSGECSLKSALRNLDVSESEVGLNGTFGKHLPEILSAVANAPRIDKRYGFLSDFAWEIGALKNWFPDFHMKRRYYHRDDVDGPAVTKLKASIERLRKICDMALSRGSTRGRKQP